MKKIGIITLNGNCNYGNKLQNYALLTYLENKGFDVNTIWFRDSLKNTIKDIIRRFMPIRNKYRRINHFEKFTKKYLRRVYYKNNKIEKLYDFFVVGSDQVWNYNLDTFCDDFFLSFSHDNIKNISYAASFGFESIDSGMVDKFISGLNNFKYISVREESGKLLAQNLTRRNDVEVVVDPTMLLTSSEWDKIVKKPKHFFNNNKKYILKYFLGNLSPSKEKQIESFAAENDCIIIDVYNKKSEFYNIGPEEFLYLEKNAFLICTDSFHSVVFAILYNRPFISFSRDENGTEGMGSRLDTLLKKFNLLQNKYSGRINKNILKSDFSSVNGILTLERKKADSYLNKALNIDND